ncbi:MAG: hypothetical protein U0797_03465 [Gemmataceae bacterium]
MDTFTRDDLNLLLHAGQAPRVSIYLPTRRGGGEDAPPRFRSCLSLVERELAAVGVSEGEARALLLPAQSLAANGEFWGGLGDGLAVFLAPGLFRSYRLPRGFPERVAVGPEFLLTPALPLVAGNGHFFVLAMSQGEVRLLRGDRESVSRVELPGAPKNLEEALATHDVDEVLNYHTHHVAGRAGRSEAIYHGHGVGVDDHKDDLVRYFRAIDRALTRALRDERAPLVLAAVGYLQPIFREVCSYPHLAPEGVPGSPDRVSARDLQERACKLAAPILARQSQADLALYRQLAGTGRTACGPEAVSAAARGEVEVLFAEPDHPVWGRLDAVGGPPVMRDPPQRGDTDLANLAAVEVLRHGGKVWPTPLDQMPSPAPPAAIFWRPHAREGKGRQSAR